MTIPELQSGFFRTIDTRTMSEIRPLFKIFGFKLMDRHISTKIQRSIINAGNLPNISIQVSDLSIIMGEWVGVYINLSIFASFHL